MKKAIKITAKVLLSTALLSSIIIPTSNQARADWKQDENGWWYDEGNGKYLADGSWSIGGKAYRFDKRGYMVTGWYYDNGDKHERLKGWYYYDPVNGDEKRGWQKIDGKWYYFNAMALTGFQNLIDGKRYYFDPVNCDMKIGWTKVDGHQYYMDPNDGGAVATNKVLLMNGVYYTFDWSGKLIKVELANK